MPMLMYAIRLDIGVSAYLETNKCKKQTMPLDSCSTAQGQSRVH